MKYSQSTTSLRIIIIIFNNQQTQNVNELANALPPQFEDSSLSALQADSITTARELYTKTPSPSYRCRPHYIAIKALSSSKKVNAVLGQPRRYKH